MTIREATSEDIDGIRDVAKASWDTDYPDILSRESIDEGFDEWYAPEQVRDSLAWADTLLLVAEDDDEIVGFAHAVWEGQGSEATKYGDILRLYVHPDYRTDGLGRQLFEAIRDELAELNVTTLRAMVLENNELGNAFYDGFGFELDDTQDVQIGGETYRENTYTLQIDSS